MPIAYIGLGSNVGDRRHYLQLALQKIGRFRHNQIQSASSIYWSTALTIAGLPGPDFLNAVCCVQTSALPQELLRHLQLIEKELGRQRHESWGPRTIDLDILDYGQWRLNQGELELPHPRMAEREFVLRPLAEIAPDWKHPISGQSVKELLEGLEESSGGGKVLGCCGSLSLSS